jgi:hypothetical protein
MHSRPGLWRREPVAVAASAGGRAAASGLSCLLQEVFKICNRPHTEPSFQLGAAASGTCFTVLGLQTLKHVSSGGTTLLCLVLLLLLLGLMRLLLQDPCCLLLLLLKTWWHQAVVPCCC